MILPGQAEWPRTGPQTRSLTVNGPLGAHIVVAAAVAAGVVVNKASFDVGIAVDRVFFRFASDEGLGCSGVVYGTGSALLMSLGWVSRLGGVGVRGGVLGATDGPEWQNGLVGI